VNTFALATIVEGEGDCAALPVLLRRLRPLWTFPRPIRVPRNKLIDQVKVSPRDEVLQRYLFLADVLISEHGGFGAVLIVQDADDDCPAALGPALRRRAQALLPSRRCEAVLPKREFEAWFLAGNSAETNPTSSPRLSSTGCSGVSRRRPLIVMKPSCVPTLTLATVPLTGVSTASARWRSH